MDKHTIEKLRAFESAAAALLEAWQADGCGGEATEYPDYLPAFEEFYADVVVWRESEVGILPGI